MIYILMIWSVVGYAGTSSSTHKKYDWRPLGEFHAELLNSGFQNGKTAKEMCEAAAKELGLNSDAYRCIRSK